MDIDNLFSDKGYLEKEINFFITIKQIRPIKNNPELARKIGENGRKLFEDRLTAEKLAGEILGLMSEARPR